MPSAGGLVLRLAVVTVASAERATTGRGQKRADGRKGERRKMKAVVWEKRDGTESTT